MNNPYDVAITGKKQEIRELLCSSLDRAEKVVTLPAQSGHDVLMFQKKWPNATIIGIEKDKKVFNAITLDNIDLYNCTISEWITSQTIPSKHIDLFFMDYCSWMTEERIKELTSLISNDNIVHKGRDIVVGMTFAKAMRSSGDKDAAIDLIMKNIYVNPGDEVDTTLDYIREFLENIIARLDISGYSFDNVMEYRATDSSQPMYFFMIRITK